jgi:hypothetical protein
MNKKPSRKSSSSRVRDRDSMRPEYDFSKGVRNKYAAGLKPGSQLVVLDPDVAAVFGDAKSVNKALRTLLEVVPRQRRRSSRRRTA